MRGDFQMAFAVSLQQCSGGIQMRVMANAGEHIQNGTLVFTRIQNAIGRQQREPELLARLHEQSDGFFFAADAMTLDFDEEIIAGKNGGRLFDRGFGACKRDEAFSKFRQFVPADAAFALGISQMRACEQPAKIGITGAGLRQYGQNNAVFHGQFRADDGADAQFTSAGKKTRRAIDTVAVAQGHARASAVARRVRQAVPGSKRHGGN